MQSRINEIANVILSIHIEDQQAIRLKLNVT